MSLAVNYVKHSASYSCVVRSFDVDAETALIPVDLLLEIFEMQSSSNLEHAFKNTHFESFFRDNVPRDKYLCLHRLAVKMTSQFDSLYFSLIKYR